MEEKEWIGFDLDGTLAKYDKFRGLDHIGEPIKPMVELFLQLLREGKTVKIFTARVDSGNEAKEPIKKWLLKNQMPIVEITNIKDRWMAVLYDDRCIQIERNTGKFSKNANTKN